MKKQMPLIQERIKADLTLPFFTAKSKGMRAIQAKNPKSKLGKERTSIIAEEIAKKILIINSGILCLA
jgi:hypothetical protein